MDDDHHHQPFEYAKQGQDEDDNQKFAFWLSAELNGEQAPSPKHHPIYAAEDEFALAMQFDFENEMKAAEQQDLMSMTTCTAYKTSDKSSVSRPARSSGDAPTADYRTEKPSRRPLGSFAEFLMHLQSYRCKCGEQFFRSELDVTHVVEGWLDGKATLPSGIKCRNCSASSCFGCIPEAFVQQSRISVQGKQASWCCADGRLFLIWILLCAFDQRFCLSRTKRIAKAKPTQQAETQKKTDEKMSQKKSGGDDGSGKYRRHVKNNMPKGLGYGSERMDFEEMEFFNDPLSSSHFGAKGDKSKSPTSSAKSDKYKGWNGELAEDDFNTMILQFLKGLLPSLDRGASFDVNPPNAMSDLLLSSKIFSYCAELLRNDSLEDATKRHMSFTTLS